jgi:plastocyanin
MSHSADYAWAPLFAVLADFHSSLVPKGITEALTDFVGEHTFSAQAYYPPYDLVSRNITTWMSDDITIGAESYHENVVGGPARSQEAFNPAVVQWMVGDYVAFISVRHTSPIFP